MTLNKPKIFRDIDTINASLGENAKSIKDFINLLDYGAKLDGVTDDSDAFQSAINDGNVSFPPNSTIYVGKTININNSHRTIDGKGLLIKAPSGVTMFQIGNLAMTSSLMKINIKDMFVDASASSSFCKSYCSYFINFEDIRIQAIKDSNIGIYIINGFNITFKNVHINGTNVGIANISGNNAKGIVLETNSTVDVNVIGTDNITNVLFDSCLIQRVETGILYNNVANTPLDTNIMSNMGFSYVDNAIITNTTKCYNQQIKLIRAEMCGVLFTNNGDITVEDCYCYETKYSFDNGSTGKIYLKGIFYHWNPTVTGGFLIKNNSGVISFKELSLFNRTPSVTRCENSFGTIIQKRSVDQIVTNDTSSFSIDQFELKMYNQQTYIDFANITGIEGSEFYIYSSNGSNFLLPNGSYQFNNLLGNMILHCKIVNGVIQVLGNRMSILPNTVNVSTLGMAKQNISVVNTQQNLTSFSFSLVGITILYSTTAGVTLSNSTGSILNYSAINGGSPIPLYNNPIMLISTGDGTTGLAIKS